MAQTLPLHLYRRCPQTRLTKNAMVAHSEMVDAMHPAIPKAGAMDGVHVAMAVAAAVGAVAVAVAVMRKALRNVSVWMEQTLPLAMQQRTKSACL